MLVELARFGAPELRGPTVGSKIHSLISASYLFVGFICIVYSYSHQEPFLRMAGITVLAIGLTVVAFGTSAPEIVVSATAASQGKVDISLGNVLGSNVANIGLVLGASAVVLSVVTVPGSRATSMIAQLRAKLPRSVRLWIGGAATAGLQLPTGATQLTDFRSLQRQVELLVD